MAPPASVRYTANTPFPSVVTGSGPIGITRANGIWTVAFNVAPLHQEIPPFVNAANEFTTFWNAATNSFSKVAFSDILSQVFSTSSQIFDSRVLAAAASITGAANWIQTRGFNSVGDGGEATYFRVGGTSPGGFQSADGAWWQLMSTTWISVKAFGARGDGATDDSAAGQAGINFCGLTGGGSLYWPTGNYVIGTMLNIPSNNFMRMTGVQRGGIVNLFTTADNTILKVSSPATIIEGFSFSGKGTPGGPATPFGATQPCIIIDGGDCDVHGCQFYGGNPILHITPNGFETFFTFCAFDFAYGDYILMEAGCWLIRCSLDHNTPTGSNPPIGTNFNARANTTHYNVSDIVSLSGYYIQCTVSGTTGGSPPALLNYGHDIIDGGVTWQLLSPVNPIGLHITGSAQQPHWLQSDNAYPVLIDSTGFDFFFADGPLEGVYVTGACSGVYITHCEMSCSPLYPPNGALGQQAVLLGPSFVGDADINGADMENVGNYGVRIRGGTNVRVRGNTINGALLAGVAADAGVSQWLVTDNYFDSPGVAAVIVAIGPSDRYIVVNNLMSLTTGINDGGTGTHKTVSPNQ